LDRGKGDKHAVIAPEVPTGGSVGQAIFDHHPYRQVNHAVGVMAPGGGEIGQIDVEILLTSRAMMRRIRYQEVNRATGGEIAEIVQDALVGFVARGELTTARAGRLLIPTVSLGVISLVASSCGYYRDQIEQHAAQ
jgi:hypothetical protein